MCSTSKSWWQIWWRVNQPFKLAIWELRRELGRVSKFNLSINWHHQIKGHIEIGYLTKLGALRLNRDQVITLETWLKIHTNVCNFVTASPQTIETLNFFTISVIFLKRGKHSDFRISSFQVEDAWRILQFNRKTEKYFKEFKFETGPSSLHNSEMAN